MRRIIETAEQVIENYGGKDVFETAENAGVKVWFRKLGSLKGLYICENGVRYIVINEQLDVTMQKVVCAHELGHDVLHRELSAGGIREGTLFLDTDKTEREANLFAACVLISDDEILNAASECDDINGAASLIGLPSELVKYKLRIMNKKGYNFRVDETENDFLK